jgi:hypothetical protein
MTSREREPLSIRLSDDDDDDAAGCGLRSSHQYQ